MTRPTPLSFGSIPRPAFGSARQHLDGPTGAPPRLTTKADRRYMRAATLAAELMPELPQPGETVHCLMLGSFDLMQVVSATAKRLPTLTHLRVATLCYSQRNVKELAALLETRPGLSLTLLVSVYFVANNKDGHASAVADLTSFPNVRVGSARSHCKVVTFDLGDGDGLVFEGSANLRGNRNREQLAAIRDRPLHDWHAAWIDELVSTSHAQQAAG